MEDGEKNVIFLNDTPNMRHLYSDYNCFRKGEVRLESLIFVISYLEKNRIFVKFKNLQRLSEIVVKKKAFKFVYKYCLSKADSISLSPQENLIIVNLHNWNGKGCISSEAYNFAESINVKLLTMDDYYKEIQKLKK